MKKYKILIFDLDDTLLDFRQAEYQSLKKLFNNNDIEFNNLNYEKYQQINKQLWNQLEQGIITKDDVVFNRFSLFCETINKIGDGHAMELEYRSYLNESSYTIDGVHSFLDKLKANEYRIYAASNGIGKTQRLRLSDAKMDKYFDGLFISEELGFEKPNINFFNKMFEAIPEFKIEHSLMIGDSLTSDIEGASRAKIDSCWYNPSSNNIQNKATYTISNLNELFEIIKK